MSEFSKKNTIVLRIGQIAVLVLILFFVLSFFLIKPGSATGAVTHYWIAAGSGNWSDGANWSITASGGITCVVPADCVPDSSSPVQFDNGGDGDVVIDATISVESIYADSNYDGNFNNNGNFNLTTTGGITWEATTGDFTVGTGTYTLGTKIYYWRASGTGNWSDVSKWSIIGPGTNNRPACNCTPDNSPTSTIQIDAGSSAYGGSYGGGGNLVVDRIITNAGGLFGDDTYTGTFDNAENYNVGFDSITWQGGDFTLGTGTYIITNPSFYWIANTIANWSNPGNWSFVGPVSRPASIDLIPNANSSITVDGNGGLAQGDITLNTNGVFMSFSAETTYIGDFTNAGSFNLTWDPNNTETGSFSWNGPGVVTSAGGVWSGPSLYFYDGITSFGTTNLDISTEFGIDDIGLGTTVNFGSGSISAGSVIVSAGTVNAQSSTISITPGSGFSDDFTLSGGIWNAGTSSLTTSRHFLSGAGTWNKDTGTVVLTGASNVSVNKITQTDFYNLTIAPISGIETFGFGSGQTFTIANALVLTGLNTGTTYPIIGSLDIGTGELEIDGTRFTIAPNGTVSGENVVVQDSTNIGTVTPMLAFGDGRENRMFSTTRWFPNRYPGGISTNLKLWLRADAEVFEATGDYAEHGDGISEWKDVSGNGITVTQSNASEKPTYRTSTSLLPEGTNFTQSVYFDGGDSIESSSGFFTDSFFISGRASSQVIKYQATTFSPLGFNVANNFTEVNGGILIGDDNVIVNSIISYNLNTRSINASSFYHANKFFAGQHNYYPETFVLHSQKGDSGLSTGQNLFMNGYQPSYGQGPPTDDPEYYQEADTDFIVGSYFNESLNPQYHFTGPINEVISFSDKLTATEKLKVDSYLAFKYGVTLVQRTGVGMDYIASDGTKIWDKTFENASTYDNDIAGLGRDDASGLFVSEAQSMNTRNVDVFSSIDDIIYMSDPNDLDNLEFMTWANNQTYKDGNDVVTPGAGNYTNTAVGYSWVETEVPSGYVRTPRQWQIQEVGDVGEVSITIPIASVTGKGLSYYTPLYLLVGDNPDLSTATPVRLVSDGIDFTLDYNFDDGEYFALAALQLQYEFSSTSASDYEDVGGNIPELLLNGELITQMSSAVSVLNSMTGTATNGVDYSSYITQAFTISTGVYNNQVYGALNFTIVDDLDDENNETIIVIVASSVSYGSLFTAVDINSDGTIGNGFVTYTIVDDEGVIVDPPPDPDPDPDPNPTPDPDPEDPPGGSTGSGCVNPNGCSGPVVGCTDSAAQNYNPNATVNQGCEYSNSDCTNPLADNYNPNASEPDFSVCIFTGCTDPNAINYLSFANNSGPCIYNNPEGCTNPNGCINNSGPILGCIDITATNYNSNATVDDGSCSYVSGGEDACIDCDTGSQPIVTTPETISNNPSTGGIILTASLFGFLLNIGFARIFNSLLRLLYSVFGFFFGRSKPWGVVYDSVTKLPLQNAIVELYDEVGIKVKFSITDMDGRYGFTVKQGIYSVVVKKEGYIFPSKLLDTNKSHDEIYRDLYFGGSIIVKKKGSIIIKNIPLDSLAPLTKKEIKKEKRAGNFYLKKTKVLSVMTAIFFFAGFTFSLIAFIQLQSIYNSIIIILYVLAYIIHLATYKYTKLGFLSHKETGLPLAFSLVRVFKKEKDVVFEFEKQVADEKGHYLCIVPNGTYVLSVDVKNPDGSYILNAYRKIVNVRKGYIAESIEL